MKALEAFLGLDLFIRQPRLITLTQAGEDYYYSVHKALMEIDRSTQKLISNHQSGELHLSVAAAFLTRWLLPRIGSFHDENPDITIEFSVAAGLVDFNTEETDMAVYFGNGEWSGIEMHLLRHYQQVPVCNPKLLQRSAINTAADLFKHTLLHVTKRPEDWPNWFAQTDASYNEKIKGIYFSNGSLTTAAAINGLGVALADIGFVSEEIASGKLVVPLEQHLQAKKSFYLVYQKSRAMTYAMKTFQGWLMKEMSKDTLSAKEVRYNSAY